MVISRQSSPVFPVSLPSVYLAHFADAVLGEDEQHQGLLRAAGLTLQDFQPDQRIDLARVLALIAAIDARTRPGWHVAPALALEAAHHGPVGVAVSTAPTMGRALELLARFEPLRMSFAALHCRVGTEYWSARVLPLIDPEGPWELLMEIHLLSLAGLLERLLARRARELLIQLPPAYRPWQHCLQARFGDRLQFKGQHYRLELPAEVLGDACRLANSTIHGDAVARCERLLVQQDAGSPLLAEVSARLLASNGPFPGIEAMSKALCCSSRTLTRRLAQSGSGYRQLVDETRRMLAIDLLQRSDHSISEIAAQLGYQDPANFGRACRRWYGKSPGRLRRGRE